MESSIEDRPSQVQVYNVQFERISIVHDGKREPSTSLTSISKKQGPDQHRQFRELARD